MKVRRTAAKAAEHALLTWYLEGEPSAFQRFWGIIEPTIRRLARAKAPWLEDDLVSQVKWAVFRTLARPELRYKRQGYSVLSWTNTVARHALQMLLAKERAFSSAMTLELEGTAVSNPENATALRHALKMLEERHPTEAQLLLMVLANGWTLAEASHETGIAKSTLHRRLTRARQFLSTVLEERDDGK
ncbi:MAG: sigma-70 family RNA polymerase sigma factor [Myxococcota bacterium]